MGRKQRFVTGDFVGWYRQHRYDTWKALTKGTSWREAWISLVDAVGQRGDDVDLVVLELGQHPNECTRETVTEELI